MGLFMIACYSIAVWGSQGIARVLYDLYNVIHLKGYELRTHYFPIPKIVVVLFTLLPVVNTKLLLNVIIKIIRYLFIIIITVF